jgi:hypothetical protein
MVDETCGLVPKLAPDFAKTLVNRAWRDVRRQCLWSFLLFDANWTSPAIVNAGTVTVTQGQNTVTFNAAASAAINAVAFSPPSQIIQRQFRVGIGTVYNIWGLDATNPSAVVLTLDRIYQEPSGTNVPYSISQCYYPSPMLDFWQWLSIRDIINYNELATNKTRAWLDFQDPQRSLFFIPTHVVPYQVDQNPASLTPGYLMHELWGPPQYVLTYQLYGLRKGVDLVNASDTLPTQVGEDCVMELVKGKAYEWAEANKQDSRMTGSDFRFLITGAKAEYRRLFREYRMQDRAAVDNYSRRLRRGWSYNTLNGWYNSAASVAGSPLPW